MTKPTSHEASPDASTPDQAPRPGACIRFPRRSNIPPEWQDNPMVSPRPLEPGHQAGQSAAPRAAADLERQPRAAVRPSRLSDRVDRVGRPDLPSEGNFEPERRPWGLIFLWGCYAAVVAFVLWSLLFR